MIGVLAVSLCASPVPSYAFDDNALPGGGNLIRGTAQLDYSTRNELHVRQQTQRAVINWNNFNIGKNARAEFHQPGRDSITVNRVTGSGDAPSQILGALKANGTVMILDHNGVFFGPDSRVDVGGIVAAAGDIDIDEFMTGNGHFKIESVNPAGVVVNQGAITVAEAGLAALVAPVVINQGVITAQLGRVELAAGTQATLDFYGDGLMELSVSQDTLAQAVINEGIIRADGGIIQLKAAAAKQVVDNLVLNTGIIAADSFGTDSAGRVTLYAQGINAIDGNISAHKGLKEGGSASINDGFITVSALKESDKGGTIEILGDHVVLGENSVLDASGSLGGGDIKVGGDYLGKGETPAAQTAYVHENAVILNDSVKNGNGGRTIVWSDHTTEYHGRAYARGGVEGGNGGFLETSGKINLLADGHADLTARAEGYAKGTYLLDPATITIHGNFDPNTPLTETELWLDGSDSAAIDCGGGGGDCADGGAIQNWLDKSGQGNHAGTPTVGVEPIYDTASLNGLSSVYFSGALDRPLSGAINRTNGGSSIFTVYHQPTGGGSDKAFLEAYGNGDRNFLIDRRFASSTLYPTVLDRVTILNADGTGTGVSQVYRDEAVVNANYTTQAGFDEGDTLTAYTIGDDQTGGNRFQGWIAEVLIYDGNLSAEDRGLVNQYFSAKWNVTLDPLAGAGSEAAEAMASTAKGDASNGFSAFTTDYLERLSNTADIILAADTTITLDFKGDTLTLADDRSISLTTANGNINTASAGTIITNRTGAGGNITFTAGGAGNISFGDAFTLNAQGGGDVALNAAGGAVSAAGGLTVTNGDLFIDADGDVSATGGLTLGNGNLTIDGDATVNAGGWTVSNGNVFIDAAGSVSAAGGLTVGGDLTIDASGISGTYQAEDAVLDSNAGLITATVSFDTLDIAGTSATLTGGYIGAPGAASQDMANLITVGGQPGPGSALYKFGGYRIGYVAPVPTAAPQIPASQTTTASPKVSAPQQGGSGIGVKMDSSDSAEGAPVNSGEEDDEAPDSTGGCLAQISGGPCVVGD